MKQLSESNHLQNVLFCFSVVVFVHNVKLLDCFIVYMALNLALCFENILNSNAFICAIVPIVCVIIHQ